MGHADIKSLLHDFQAGMLSAGMDIVKITGEKGEVKVKPSLKETCEKRPNHLIISYLRVRIKYQFLKESVLEML